MKRIVILTLVAAALLVALMLSQRRREPGLVSGFIEADEIRVGSRVGGRVARVLVEEGSEVKAGDLLVELEPFDLLQRRAEAEALLAARRAEHARLTSGFRPEESAQAKARVDRLQAQLNLLLAGPRKEDIAAAEAQLQLAQAQLELARADFDRQKSLFDRGVSAREEYDRAQSQLRVAQETVQSRQEEVNKLREGTRPEEIEQARAQLEEARQAWQLQVRGFRVEEIEQAEAQVRAAEAQLLGIDQQVAELTIEAPVNGRVEAIELQPGDLVAANAPVISIIDPSHLWVRAYIPEDMLGVKIGDEVAVGVDSFLGERFAARVTFVSRQAEFLPGNVQTPEERSKQVFRAKITLEEGLDRLRPGMAADVWLKE
jgi:HlyD family secretion protein